MDYEEEFWKCVRDTIALMTRRGTAKTKFTASSGASVNGWLIERYTENVDGKGPNGGPLERWHNELVLGDDGSFYNYGVEWTYGQGETTSLSRQDYGLAGNQGKPFSRLKAKVERLPYG